MDEELTTSTQELIDDLNRRGIDYLRHGNVVVWLDEVGPARADKYLEDYGIDYRKYRDHHARKLARDMVNGEWNFDGMPLRFDELMNFLDGQHRANAVKKSNTRQLFLHVAGLPSKAYDTADQGLPRQYTDTLRRRGKRNVTNIAAAIKMVASWEDGRPLTNTRAFTTSELDKVYEAHADELDRANELAVGAKNKIAMPVSVITFVWWLLRSVDLNRATTFMRALEEGVNLYHNHPAKYLRERLYRDLAKGIVYNRMEYLWMVFKAWEAFCKGETLQTIMVPTTITRRNLGEPYRPPVSDSEPISDNVPEGVDR